MILSDWIGRTCRAREVHETSGLDGRNATLRRFRAAGNRDGP